MVRWQLDEAERSWLPHAAEDAKSDDKGNVEGGSQTDTAVDEYRNEVSGRVVRFWNLCLLLPRILVLLVRVWFVFCPGGGRNSGSAHA